VPTIKDRLGQGQGALEIKPPTSASITPFATLVGLRRESRKRETKTISEGCPADKAIALQAALREW
ncbi:MAG: hypothetical protein LBU69_04675, partial [Deltaproteobacteria bacterium]|nr:hypothetical protein [Deltaproteobacteria bacterium]